MYLILPAAVLAEKRGRDHGAQASALICDAEVRAVLSALAKGHMRPQRAVYDAARARFVRSAGSRIPPDHQMRQAPSSETMHGPMGWRGWQAAPNSRHSFG